MLSFLILLFALRQLQNPVYSEIVSGPHYNLNALSEPDDFESIVSPESSEDGEIIPSDIPFVKSGPDQTDIEFRRPINSVNIDYSGNAVILKFRKQPSAVELDELERRKSLETNFMRFGRSPNFMRLGKRAIERMPNANSIGRDGRSQRPGSSRSDRFERSSEIPDRSDNVGFRDSRGDNFMRFGRSPKHDYMRFGRDPARDFMRFGRNPGQNYMRLGRNPGENFMRFGRNPGQNYMRFGRNPGQDYMRFGRNPGQDYMRLGRASADFMRLGRANDKNFLRFGRAENFMRFGRDDSDGSADKSSNFMRFGRMNANAGPILEENTIKGENRTSTRLLQKNDIKEAAKLLQETDPSNDESNPMDKAIQVLFSKQDNDQHKDSKEESSQEIDY